MTVSVNDFLASLKMLEEQAKAGGKSVLSAFDRLTYGMLVDCLKSQDPNAVKEAIDGLARERRLVGVPPLYLVSVAHPNEWVREQAKAGLAKLVSPAELEKITQGKDTKVAVTALIEQYGHYRA